MDKTTFRIVRRAAALLAPVLIRTGSRGQCCEAHIEEVSDDQIRVWPVHTPSLGRSQERTSMVIPGEGLGVYFDGYIPDGPDAILLRPAEAVARRFADRARWEGGGACLAIPGGVDGVHLFPVTDVSADVVTLRSERGFPEGTLDAAELIHRSTVIRRCSYTVIENIPWCDPQGRRSFRTRLRAQRALHAPEPTSVVTDAGRIAELVGLAQALGVTGQVNPSATSAFSFAGSDHRGLRLDTEIGALGPDRVSLTFELLGTLYRFNARVVERGNRHAIVSAPVVLRIVGRRREKRTALATAEARATIDHPLCGRIRGARILDISETGLRIVGDALDTLPLWQDLPLEGVRVKIGGRSHSLGPAIVRSTDEGGMSLQLTRPVPSAEFRAALTALRSPELAPHNGDDFPSQLAFYRRMKMMKPYMEELAVAHLPLYTRSWRNAHSADSVVRTFSRRERDRVVASVTALRAWEGTWMGQQLLADRNREGCSPGALLMTFMDHILPRPDCERMMFLAERSNTKMTGIHERFAGMTGTNESMTTTQVDFWLKRDAAGEQESILLRPPKKRELSLIENAATREFGRETAEALSLTAATAKLKRLSSDYASLGLRRTRDIDIVEVDGVARYAFFHEHTPWGLCLSSVVNCTWVLPLLPCRDEAMAATQFKAALAAFGPEPGQPFRSFMTPRRLGANTQAALGMQRIYELNLFVINRSGLRRYMDFLGQAYAPYETKEERTHRAVG